MLILNIIFKNKKYYFNIFLNENYFKKKLKFQLHSLIGLREIHFLIVLAFVKKRATKNI